MNIYSDNKGFISIVVVIIVGAATMIMAVSASLLSMGDMELSRASDYGHGAQTIAESCLEEGLRRLAMDPEFYATAKTYDIDSGSCVLNVSGSGASRRLTAAGMSGEYEKKLEIEVSLNEEGIDTVSWQEDVD